MCTPRTAFLDELARLPGVVDDSCLDALVDRYFGLARVLSPDIVRAYVRRSLGRPETMAATWEALSAVAADVANLDPTDRAPGAVRPWAQ